MRTRGLIARAGSLAAVVVALFGCAAAVPSFGGGSTTPAHRGDVLAGGAVRVPLGGARLPEAEGAGSFGGSAGAGGVAPVVGGRYGIARGWDVGLLVAGTTARLSVRREVYAKEAVTRPAFVIGAALTGGWIRDEGLDGVDDDGSGWRLGVEVPLLYAIEFGAIGEVWLGARLGADYVAGEFAAVPGGSATLEDASAAALRAGPILGLSLGLRRVHALLELTAYYEHWLGELGQGSLDEGGFVLVPGFALRVRI